MAEVEPKLNGPEALEAARKEADRVLFEPNVNSATLVSRLAILQSNLFASDLSQEVIYSELVRTGQQFVSKAEFLNDNESRSVLSQMHEANSASFETIKRMHPSTTVQAPQPTRTADFPSMTGAKGPDASTLRNAPKAAKPKTETTSPADKPEPKPLKGRLLEVLEAIKNAGPEGITYQELGQKINVAPQTLQAYSSQIRTAGYDLESVYGADSKVSGVKIKESAKEESKPDDQQN